MIIEQESPNHYEAVYKLIKIAFENAEHSDGNEHKLTEKLRNSLSFVPELSLIAKIESQIIGHIMFTISKINGKEILTLAPVSVLPNYQNQGVGSALIKEGLKKAKYLGFIGVTVVGNPEYYKRFGFEKASKWKILSPFEIEEKFFMATELIPHTLIEGTLEYAAEFFEV